MDNEKSNTDNYSLLKVIVSIWSIKNYAERTEGDLDKLYSYFTPLFVVQNVKITQKYPGFEAAH